MRLYILLKLNFDYRIRGYIFLVLNNVKNK